MQQAIGNHFPNTRATFKFTHRDPDVLFPRKAIDLFRKSVQGMSSLSCSPRTLSMLIRFSGCASDKRGEDLAGAQVLLFLR